MKEDLSKPLYKDCKAQKGYKFFWIDPVISRERSYLFADMPLAITGWLLIVLAIGVIGWSYPYWNGYILDEVPMIFLVFIIIAEFFYMRKFVYRFGRFRVTWADEARHSDEEASSRYDKDGKFLKTEENRVAAKKSRRAFLALFAGIIAAILLYCFLWIALSYLRVISWHRGEIEEVKQIAQKYDYVYADESGQTGGKTESEWNISEQDKRRLWEISQSMRWEYVREISMYTDSGDIKIDIKTIFGYSKLLWFEDIRDTSQVKNYFGPVDTAVQLDEHWFYFRMDDGRFF